MLSLYSFPSSLSPPQLDHVIIDLIQVIYFLS